MQEHLLLLLLLLVCYELASGGSSCGPQGSSSCQLRCVVSHAA
jgi:hypothetical protein